MLLRTAKIRPSALTSGLFFHSARPRYYRFRPTYGPEAIDNVTHLHQMIHERKSLANINEFVKSDYPAAIKMAHTVDNRDRLPYDVLDEISADETVNALKALMVLLMIENPLPLQSLTDLIDVDAVLKKYEPKEDTELYKNLELGCQLINRTRGMIKASATHPEMNKHTSAELNHLTQKITHCDVTSDLALNRVLENTNNDSIVFSESTFHFHEYNKRLSWQAGMALLRTTNQPYYSSKKANCEAMAFCLGEQYIKTTGGEKSGGVFNIEKGGHCVFVMGQGNNKVISDAWSGQAYPVYDVVKSLWDFRRYIVDDPHNKEVPRKINVLTTCNPRYS